MKKIVLALVLSLCFIAMSANIAVATNVEEELDSFPKNIDVPEIDLENFSYYGVMTAGPARYISDINFIQGNQYQIDRIENLMRISLFKPDFRTVVVTNMTFEVTYTRSVQKLSRFSYATAYGELSSDLNMTDEPEVIYNTAHNVTVTNFTGAFHFLRPTFYRPIMFKFFVPAQFIFVGVAENVTSEPLYEIL